MAGQGNWWRRFRVSPDWCQIIVWAVATPVPPVLLAATRRTRRSWIVAGVVTLVWATAVGFGAQHAPAAARFVGKRPEWWYRSGLAAGLAAALYSVVVLVPTWIVRPAELTREQLLKARNDVRSSLFAALGGAVALGGAFIGGYVGLKQLEVNRQGQITERFTRAIDQIGNEALDTRVGGIFALERIARDSRPDHKPVLEVLTAFVREHAPPADARDTRASNPAIPESAGARVRLRGDLQAVFTVLPRLVTHPDKAHENLDTSQERLDLTGIQMAGVLLREVDLQWVDLTGAVLSGTDLRRAELRFSMLRHANLQGADFEEAKLNRADLIDADLRKAFLRQTELVGAVLIDAKLQEAKLPLAILAEADLRRATLRGATLEDANLELADLEGADLEGVTFGEAYLHDANLKNANLQKADLRGTNLETVILEGAKLGGARADGSTRWPAGFDPKGAGVVME